MLPPHLHLRWPDAVALHESFGATAGAPLWYRPGSYTSTSTSSFSSGGGGSCTYRYPSHTSSFTASSVLSGSTFYTAHP